MRLLWENRRLPKTGREASFIWDNYYDRESMRNEYELAILSLREPADCTVSMRKSTISVHTRCQDYPSSGTGGDGVCDCV